MADTDITLRDVITHMQGMEQRLSREIASVRLDLTALEVKVDRGFALIQMQLHNIDERLDDIEVVQIPTLKKATRIQ